MSHHPNERNTSQAVLKYDSIHSGAGTINTHRSKQFEASPVREQKKASVVSAQENELNLSGEQVAIKQSILKTVTYEGVLENLDEKVSQSAASRLLFSR